jgi:cell division protein ZapA
MTNRYDVNIAGYTLTVQTDRTAEHMDRLAAFVNERVREIQKAGSTTNYLNVILLAAITLADEVVSMREREEAEKKRVEEAGRSLLAMMEQALDPER